MIVAAALIRDNWKAIAGAAVAAALVWYVQELRLDAVRADLRATQIRVGVLKDANDKCAADVKAVRVAVDDLQRQADERAKAADMAVAAAELVAQKFRTRAEELAAAKPASADDCKAADAFTAGYFDGRKK